MKHMQAKAQSDLSAMQALQTILAQRQDEYAGIRKQYALVESAIRATPYVKEI